MRRRAGRRIWVALFLLLLLGLYSCKGQGAVLVASLLDVGQGDATLVELPSGQTILIDAGTRSAGVADLLLDLGVQTIDYLVLTHPHEDHIGGAPRVIREFRVGEVWMPRASHTTQVYEDLLLAIREKDLDVLEAQAGAVMIDSGDIRATFIGPVGVYDNLNDMSAVLHLIYGKTVFLFQGDAELAAEADMLEAGLVPKAHVLKVGHHGSGSSSSEKFVSRVSPQIAVIHVGKNNSYGHPSDTVLRRLEAAGAKVTRTDIHGTVVIKSDGLKVSVSVP